MKAWEIAADLFRNAVPKLRTEEEETWEDNISVSEFYDQQVLLSWGSNVPGSGAPEKIMVAAIQAMENRGYRASKETEELLARGLEAAAARDMVLLHQISARMNQEILRMEKDENAPYWKYRCFQSFEEYAACVDFPAARMPDYESAEFRDRIYAAWLSQLIGAAFGTMVEGYTSENLRRAYGEIRDYLRKPDTYNDDITYELAFLSAFSKYGYDVTSEQIALEWIGLIPAGWSAEEIALRNIRLGLKPPRTGTYGNPFSEWIGAQMRGGICGMAAPGDPRMAAALAWRDAEVSHAGNGILGEVFNAVLTSLAFVEQDIRKLVTDAILLIPEGSEYREVLQFALSCCRSCQDYQSALSLCQERYVKYNWIHAYPNACCEIIALWYGGGDYGETLHTVIMCGYDADCNAAMILPLLAIQKGMCIIPEKLIRPEFSVLTTYMRRYRKISLEELADDTLSSIKKAVERRNAK